MAVIFRDTFTGGTPGDNLTTHTTDSNGSWAKLTGVTGDVVLSDAAAARGNDNGVVAEYLGSVSPLTRDQDIEANFIHKTGAPFVYYVWIAGQADTAAETSYAAVRDSLAGTWKITKFTGGGGSTDLGSYSQALSNGVTYNIRLELRTNSQKLYVDNVLRVTTTDSAIIIPGCCGLGIYSVGASTDFTGTHWDDYIYTDQALPWVGYQPVLHVRDVRPPRALFRASLTSPVFIQETTSTISLETWESVSPTPQKKLQVRSGAIAPVYVHDVTATVPPESWQGSAPHLVKRLTRAWVIANAIRGGAAGATSIVLQPASPTFSSATPPKLQVIQYQAVVSPLVAATMRFTGKTTMSMAVPYRLEVTQYETFSGPVRIADVTAVAPTWAPVVASSPDLGWGRAVSSGLTPPGSA